MAAVDTYLKWPASRKLLVWLVVSVVIGALYYFLGFQPQVEQLRSLESNYERLGQELRESQAIANNLQEVKEEVRLLDERLAQALEKLPNKEEIPALLQTVSDLGKEAGLEFLLFKPGAATPQQFYAEVPLDLEIEGRYHDLGLFFDKIGRLPRIVTIQNISFGGAKIGVGGVKLKASCRAVTFKFLEASQQAPAGQGGTK